MAIHPPLQQRSRATLRRILEGTEKLLETRTFEEIGIQDIVRRAKTSVGAFYARFPSKDALLPALYERYDATLPTQRAELVERNDITETADFAQRLRETVRFSIRIFRERRGLMRALTIHARKNPEAIPLDARERRRQLHTVKRDLVLEFADEIDHIDKRAAVDMGLNMIVSTIRERILFDDAPHASAVTFDDATLEEEMTRALFSYLRGPALP